MLDLFSHIEEEDIINQNLIVNNNILDIEGLQYIPNFISENEEKELMNAINSEKWLTVIKRRVQHYGYKYDYKARTINYSMHLGKLPIWSMEFANRLVNKNYIKLQPDQIIVNEYEPGQGIANHVDCEPCFGDTIITISLNSYCTMDFINLKTRQKIEVLLEPRSLVVINGESRYLWSHGIPSRKTDFHNNQKINRKLRISLTFRNVILR